MYSINRYCLHLMDKKKKIKKYDHETFSDMTKETILSSHRGKTQDILDNPLVWPASWVAA